MKWPRNIPEDGYLPIASIRSEDDADECFMKLKNFFKYYHGSSLLPNDIDEIDEDEFSGIRWTKNTHKLVKTSLLSDFQYSEFESRYRDYLKYDDVYALCKIDSYGFKPGFVYFIEKEEVDDSPKLVTIYRIDNSDNVDDYEVWSPWSNESCVEFEPIEKSELQSYNLTELKKYLAVENPRHCKELFGVETNPKAVPASQAKLHEYVEICDPEHAHHGKIGIVCQEGAMVYIQGLVLTSNMAYCYQGLLIREADIDRKKIVEHKASLYLAISQNSRDRSQAKLLYIIESSDQHLRHTLGYFETGDNSSIRAVKCYPLEKRSSDQRPIKETYGFTSKYRYATNFEITQYISNTRDQFYFNLKPGTKYFVSSSSDRDVHNKVCTLDRVDESDANAAYKMTNSDGSSAWAKEIRECTSDELAGRITSVTPTNEFGLTNFIVGEFYTLRPSAITRNIEHWKKDELYNSLGTSTKTYSFRIDQVDGEYVLINLQKYMFSDYDLKSAYGNDRRSSSLNLKIPKIFVGSAMSNSITTCCEYYFKSLGVDRYISLTDGSVVQYKGGNPFYNGTFYFDNAVHEVHYSAVSERIALMKPSEYTAISPLTTSSPDRVKINLIKLLRAKYKGNGDDKSQLYDKLGSDKTSNGDTVRVIIASLFNKTHSHSTDVWQKILHACINADTLITNYEEYLAHLTPPAPVAPEVISRYSNKSHDVADHQDVLNNKIIEYIKGKNIDVSSILDTPNYLPVFHKFQKLLFDKCTVIGWITSGREVIDQRCRSKICVSTTDSRGYGSVSKGWAIYNNSESDNVTITIQDAISFLENVSVFSWVADVSELKIPSPTKPKAVVLESVSELKLTTKKPIKRVVLEEIPELKIKR